MTVPPDPTATQPSVSVVVPVLNEERHLADAVAMILAQDYPGPLDVVLALGPSTDATDAVAAALTSEPRVRTVANPSGRTPDGLNAAIGASDGEIVVRVDGHAELTVDYVRCAVAELARVGADNVGGIMDAQGTTPFERAVAWAMRSPLGVGSARFHTGGEAGAVDTVYLGVFRREALTRVGGFDSRFTRTQDWELNHRIRATGGTIWFSPRLRVVYRPRASVRALARQYLEYGRWRRVVTRLHPDTVSVRYLAAPAALVGCVVGLVGGLVWWPLFVLPVGYAAVVVIGGLALSGELSPAERLLVPVVLPTMHLAWGWGFLTSRIRIDEDSPPH